MAVVKKSVAVVALWLPAAAMWSSWFAWRDRLPGELPTHWSGSGPADAVTPASAFFGGLVAVALGAALLGTVLLLLPLAGRWVQRGIGAAAAAVAAFVLAMWLGSTVTALDVSDPYTVHLGAWVLVALASPCYGFIPLFLLPLGEKPPVTTAAAARDARASAAASTVPLSEAGDATWSRTIVSRLFIVLTIVMAAIGAAIFVPLMLAEGFGEAGWGALVFGAAVLLAAAFSAFRVTVDARGLRVTSLPWRIRLKHIALQDIASAEAASLVPMDWGGWGYRIMPGRSAIILRGGPGLVVTLTNNKQFAITLDEPQQAAAVLRALTADRVAP